MTHSGGKPHNVGDRGQRYMVTYCPTDDPDAPRKTNEKTFGYSNDMDGAEAFCQSIELHPSMFFPEIVDRSTTPHTIIVR